MLFDCQGEPALLLCAALAQGRLSPCPRDAEERWCNSQTTGPCQVDGAGGQSRILGLPWQACATLPRACALAAGSSSGAGSTVLRLSLQLCSELQLHYYPLAGDVARLRELHHEGLRSRPPDG